MTWRFKLGALATVKRWLMQHVRAFNTWLKPVQHKALLLLIAFVMAITQITPFLQPHVEAQRYKLDDVNHLLPRQSSLLAQKLKFDGEKQQFNFNEDYSPSTVGSMDSGGYRKNGSAKIKAAASVDPSKGVTVTDPVNNVDFTLIPKMDLLAGRQDANRVYYPLKDNTGWLVYTMQADQVAEDLVLTKAKRDSLHYKYELGLGDALAARLQSDGSIGIFGSDLPISGQVSTGNDKDAELLTKLRKNSQKNKLLFTLPAPVIRQSKAGDTKVTATFALEGNELTLHVSGLKTGNYPIDIDPSVYVQSAQGLMYGNNETNINFDTTNNLFQKTTVSGGNIRDGVTQNSWTTSTALPAGLMGHATAISGGYIYVVGGSTTGATGAATNKVYWAKLNVSTSQAIGSWTTNNGYNLPVNLSRHSLVAYNDYLYVIGGNTGSATSSSVYSLHLAASGEPTPNWVALSSTLPGAAGYQYHSAIASENRLYVFGGINAATGNTATANTYMAEINPDGTIGTWNTLNALPQAVWGSSAAVYNGFVYVVGGGNGDAILSTVYYAPITASGIGTWQTNDNAMSVARSAIGGNFMTIWAGYIYAAGGCSAVAASTTECSATPISTIQQASINADGSITTWTTLQRYDTGTSSFVKIDQARSGYGLVSFGTANDPSAANAGGTLYAIGGCTSSQSASVCTTTTAATYAEISSEGDVGPAENTTELPLAAGWFASAVVVNNGYIYNIGGCRIVNNVNGCTTTTNTIYYAQLNANGTVGTWNPTTTTLPANRAAAGAAVLGNVLYVAGGTTGTTASTNVYSAVLASNGNITTAFNTSTTGLAAAALYPFTFAYVNPSAPTTGYLTTVGGCTQSTADGIGCNGYVSTVRRCPVATVGTVGLGTCVGTTGTPGGILQLPNETGIAAGAVHGSYVYLASGANPDVSGTAGAWGGQTNLTYYAKIDNSGNLVVPPGKSGTTWALITAKLANNGVTDTGTNNAPGQRRRASAYAVNGYLYVLGGHDGNSTSSANGQTLQDVEIGKIDPSTGDIASFVDNYYQIAPRWDFKGAAANGFIYAVGGCTGGFPPAGCTAADRSVQYMQIYNNYSGTPASYNAAAGTSAILNPMYGGSSAISNGYIYVAGGTTSPGSIPNNDVQYAPIASDGTIGAWTAVPGSSSGTLDIRRMFFKLVAANGYLYALGGQSGTGNNSSLATVEKSLLDPLTGVPGRFNVEAATGFTARSGLDAVFYNGYLYVTGGMGTTGSTVNTVAYSQVNPTTGTLSNWTNSANTFTTARMFHSAVAYNGTLYVLGGYTGSAYLSDVQYAQINSNGSIGTFNTTQNLPQPVSQGTAYAANGYLYVLAGRSGATTTSCTNNTYVASLSANSTVANGNVPNGLGGWTQTAVTYAGPRYGATTSYSAGKVYLFGGSQCATSVVVAAGTTTYYGTLQSQPQVASYSYAIDALYDVFPSKSLFNGIDNGIGANWRLSYRSSTNAAKVWGRNTDYGKTTLGVPQTYIPLDGSGASTSFARYYWIKLSIDGSQAFGYPEDVSRGPTIANLTLQFTANPSQRLRNGKTFINNVEQPLDAPF